MNVAEFEQTIALLLRDVSGTVGDVHRDVVTRRAAELRTYVPRCAGDKLVHDVQQYFHDTFVDTTWPACPLHHRHPLWFRDAGWWCERDNVRLVALGELHLLDGGAFLRPSDPEAASDLP